MLYPLLFESNLHTVVWGGHRLKPLKGLVDDGTPIGESWEVSAVPGSVSIVRNGEFAGCSLTQLVEQFGAELLGNSVWNRYGSQFPLLVKFIDADRDLSIQVHPNDELAQARHQKFGKTEMWYVIDAKPGSYLYAGFNQHITQYEYEKRVLDGSITEVLARHEVRPGDVFFIPAGRVHAICSGILLAEVQQSSDITYRIFDYNRLGLDGTPRQLHTELAKDAIDFEVVDEYRTLYDRSENEAKPIVVSPYFNVRVLEATSSFHRNLMKYDSFIISMCMKGSCTIHLVDDSTGQFDVNLQAGNSCLIPASVADYMVMPGPDNVTLLEAFIDNKDTSLISRASRFLHLSRK